MRTMIARPKGAGRNLKATALPKPKRAIAHLAPATTSLPARQAEEHAEGQGQQK